VKLTVSAMVENQLWEGNLHCPFENLSLRSRTERCSSVACRNRLPDHARPARIRGCRRNALAVVATSGRSGSENDLRLDIQWGGARGCLTTDKRRVSCQSVKDGCGGHEDRDWLSIPAEKVAPYCIARTLPVSNARRCGRLCAARTTNAFNPGDCGPIWQHKNLV